ncbi:MAG: HRDC domain-containing protein [Polyangiales bacterium]
MIVIDRAEQIEELAQTLSASASIPLDVESNGLHAYRAVLCTMQLALVTGGPLGFTVHEVYLVDTLSIGDEALAPLRDVLGPFGPPKILHDLAFDARMLRQHGIALGRVIDTAIAARFLGIQQSGLASVVESKLGVKLSKELQHHDWGKRPLEPEVLPYLAADVEHLPELARLLFEEASARDITPEIEAETDYRVMTALADDGIDPRPPYVRIKGVQGLDPVGRAILRRLAEIREDASRRADVPPFKMVGNDVLLAIARTRKIEPVRGRGASLASAFRRAVDAAVAEGDVPPDDQVWFTEPTPPPKLEVQARRAREQRLTAWRRKTAKERSLDEQVVLPGHCVQDLADRVPVDLAELAAIPGIGARRVERDGAAILAALAPIG